MLAIYYFVFGYINQPVRQNFFSLEGGNIALTLFAGLNLHALLAECLSRAPLAITTQPSYVKRVVFPLHLLPFTVVGAAFLGAVTDAMLLGHWYLVQPGLPRSLLNELVQVTQYVLPIEVAALLLPTGMLSVLSGTVSDGWNGTLGYFWVACSITTAVLCWVTKRALRERYYSAVMAATGLLYLAILTAFGTDLVARAVLAG